MSDAILSLLDMLAQEKHHWSWYQTNGKSAEENYMLQKEEMRRYFLIQEIKRKLIAEEASKAASMAADVQLTIKS